MTEGVRTVVAACDVHTCPPDTMVMSGGTVGAALRAAVPDAMEP